MSEEEKEAIESLRIQVMNFNEKEDRILLNYIDKLQKENQELKEENIILEGNKIGYKLAIQELEKTIDLIIDDFQAENYFINMTNKEVREYYKKRKELEE